MLNTRTRGLTVIASAALLAATVAGCGGGSSSKSAGDNPNTPAPSITDSDGASTSSDGTTPGDGSTSGTSSQVYDFVTRIVDAMKQKKSAHMTMALGSSMSAQADMEYLGDATNMKMRMTTGGSTVEVILVDGVMYLQQAPGAKYTKIDKSDPAMGPLLNQFKNLGPAASVGALKEGIKKITDKGKVKIGGEELRKYELTVDSAAVARQLGASAAAAGMPKTVTYTLYLDDQDLLRQVNMEVSGQKIVMTVSDWGKPVDIKAPPASRVQTR